MSERLLTLVHSVPGGQTAPRGVSHAKTGKPDARREWATASPYAHRLGVPNLEKFACQFQWGIVDKYASAFFRLGTDNISDAVKAQAEKIKALLHEVHTEMATLNLMVQKHDEQRRAEIQAQCDARNPTKRGRNGT